MFEIQCVFINNLYTQLWKPHLSQNVFFVILLLFGWGWMTPYGIGWECDEYQVITCWLMAPGHNLNHHRLISEILLHWPQHGMLQIPITNNYYNWCNCSGWFTAFRCMSLLLSHELQWATLEYLFRSSTVLSSIDQWLPCKTSWADVF